MGREGGDIVLAFLEKGGDDLDEQDILMEPEQNGQVLEDGTATDVDVQQLLQQQEEKLRQVRIDGEVRYMLAKMGAKNPTLAAKVLDLSAVQVRDDGVVGVEESVKRLMATDPYLFGHTMGPVGGERSSGGVHGGDRRDPNGMSDREYYAMVMGKR